MEKLELQDLRKGLSGLYKISEDEGYSYDYYAVTNAGQRNGITEGRYNILRAGSKERKDYESKDGKTIAYSVAF